MEYLLAITRAIGLILTYIAFGLIGLGLLIIFCLSMDTYHRSIVFFTQLWAKCSCLVLNIKVKIISESRVCPGSLIVANHVGTPDIFVMGSCFPAFFVSKAEIGRWPFMSWLAKLGATIFVNRNQRQQVRFTIKQVLCRLKAGCSVILFPEGQVTDGKDILPFKSSHFETAIQTGKPVVPVVIIYHDDKNPSVACWHNINFLTHIIRLLKYKRLDVTVEVLSSLQGESDRRILALKCHDVIRKKYLSSTDRKITRI